MVERKYLRAIGIAAVVLTLLMLFYTMLAATTGNHAGSTGTAPTSASDSASQNQGSGEQVDPNLFPRQLAGMTQSDVISGQDAINSVAQLHGKDIKVASAAVVTYTGKGSDKMIIWFTETPNEQNAKLLFKEMDDKMPQSSGFQNHKKVTVDGKAFEYVTSSDGMQHYYWQTGKRVMWVEIMSANAEDVIKQVAPLY